METAAARKAPGAGLLIFNAYGRDRHHHGQIGMVIIPKVTMTAKATTIRTTTFRPPF
jgi:hypothetical protein